MEEGPALSWDALPFGAIAAAVQHWQALPPHQAVSALAAARLLCRHWRHAVDDAMTQLGLAAEARPGAVAAMLSRWRHLHRLALTGGQLDGAGLDALSRCRRLERISLWGVDAPTQQLCGVLAQLPRLAAVEYRAADGLPANASIAALAGCTALRSLSLDGFWEQHVSGAVWFGLVAVAVASQRAANPL